MSQPDSTLADSRWNAVCRRDRDADGRFLFAVTSTGIYCRPSCPARRPLRENIRFFDDTASAQANGFRACKRCRPDETPAEALAVAAAVRLIEASEAPPTLAEMAAAAGLSPHHFHRLFRRETGLTPAAYTRAIRAARAQRALSKETKVTNAIYEAGFASAGRFYAEATDRLGMTPGTRRRGGAGEVIRHAVVDTKLGKLLVAATDKGLCRIAFDEDAGDLRRHFPGARIEPADTALSTLIEDVVRQIDGRPPAADLPLDIRGTAFQERVWQALTRIPAGETRTYAQIAAAAGNPSAVRAAGSACGANPVSIVVPCHRVLRSGGGLGGYAWGLDRKRALLAGEGVVTPAPEPASAVADVPAMRQPIGLRR